MNIHSKKRRYFLLKQKISHSHILTADMKVKGIILFIAYETIYIYIFRAESSIQILLKWHFRGWHIGHYILQQSQIKYM